jgi:predicted LPLAT superfamily acyltransferase
MRMAAVLRQRVFFMAGLYRGGNRYDVIFEELADFTHAAGGRGERAALVEAAIARYAARLEHYARQAPDNWFNFHDFWSAR